MNLPQILTQPPVAGSAQAWSVEFARGPCRPTRAGTAAVLQTTLDRALDYGCVDWYMYGASTADQRDTRRA